MNESKNQLKLKVLITGANGFIGTNLTKYLSMVTNFEIYAMVRNKETTRFLHKLQFKENTNEKLFEMVEANLKDENSIIELTSRRLN